MSDLKFKRVLLKISGEAFIDKSGNAFDISLLKNIANEIKPLIEAGAQIAIVTGGGNIMRGANQNEIDREKADYMGMIATVINSMTLCEVLKNEGLNSEVFSAIAMPDVCKTYDPVEACESLDKGNVVVLGGGTGKPFCTTDTNATLRANELNCDCVLKATKVDGVYDDDPAVNKDAQRFDTLSFNEAIDLGLKIMDEKAFTMAQENGIPIVVFNMFETGNIAKVVQGQNVGTVVS